MPFYYDFPDAATGAMNVPRTAQNMIELRELLDNNVPDKSVFERLLLATWNIQAFGGTTRTEESLW